MMISPEEAGQAWAGLRLKITGFMSRAANWCSKRFHAPPAAFAKSFEFANRLIARTRVSGIVVAGPVPANSRRPPPSPENSRTSLIKGGFAMKRRLATALVFLVFGWLTTAAMAADDTAAGSADSATAAGEPTAPDQATDTATAEPATDSSSDGTISTMPAETESK